MIALMLIGNASFAADTKNPAKKAKAKTECRKSDCKDVKDCKDKKDCKKVCTPSCNK